MSDFTSNPLDYVATPVFALEPDDKGVPRYCAFNTAAQLYSGITPDLVIGRTAYEVYAGRFGRTAYEHHCCVLRTGVEDTYEIELPFKGAQHWIRTTLKPIKDRKGRVSRLIGTCVDITSVEHAREVQANITTIHNEMEQFIAMAAHDLRAPMRNVGLLVEMLREDFVDRGDGKMELLDMIEKVAEHSATLITDVLNHACATTATPQVEMFDFAGLCQSLCGVLDPTSQHDIDWSGGHILGDRTAFHIVLRNLMDNAIKHGGKERLEIHLEARGTATGLIEVTLRDTGKGFDNPGRAFLDSGEFRVDSGYGLLGIQRLVRARGGTIEVTNRCDTGGSHIRFSLPGRMAGQGTSDPSSNAAQIAG